MFVRFSERTKVMKNQKKKKDKNSNDTTQQHNAVTFYDIHKEKKNRKKKNKKKRKSTKKKRKINKKANDQKVNYPKGRKSETNNLYGGTKKNKSNIAANGGPLLCHTIKAISRRIFSNEEQCQFLIKDYNCF